MRPVKYHVASTLDGFIAHPDSSIHGFVNEGEHATDYVAALHQAYDTVLMGRRTYEFGFQFDVTNPYPWLKQYVLSRTMESSPDANVTLIATDALDFVRGLKRAPGKAIYLCGGAELASALFGAQLIDEVVVKLNPVVFGAGIPLFADSIQQTALELTESKVYSNSVVLLHYRVKY